MRLSFVACVLLGACSFQHGVLGDRDGAVAEVDADDDATIDAAPPGPWGTPSVVVLAQPTNTDDDPSPTDDRLELYINSSRGGNADVYVSIRSTTAEAWSIPAVVPLVSSAYNETTPEVSYDGLSMVVASDRPGTLGGYDLWLSKRTSRTSAWSDPQPISGLSTAAAEAAGNMTSDGLAIVFTRYQTSYDMFMATRASTSAPWGTPVELTALNTAGHEGSPFITDDKLTIYFDSDRSGTLDIFTSHRDSTTEAFPTAVPVTEVNTSASDEDPWLSRDGRHFLYTSTSGGSLQLWEMSR